jgi:hypothetical protein
MSKFIEFRDAVTKRIQHLYSLNPNFVVLDVSREDVWEAYLDGFKRAENKQYHNCNSCKSFLTRFGRTATVIDGELHYILDVETNNDYQPAVDSIVNLIKDAEVKGFYFTSELGYSKKSNMTGLGSAHGVGVTFNHLYVDFKESCPSLSRADATAHRSKKNNDVAVLKRAAEEIPVRVVDEIIELHASNLLPRGSQYIGMVQEFKKFLNKYANNLLCLYEKGFILELSHIWNSAIGTMMRDMAEGKSTMQALEAYGKMVDGANYKRPKFLVTKKQVDKAKETLQEAGALPALYRRHATAGDINVNDCLYVNSTVDVFDDVFADMKKDVVENPSKYLNSPELPFSQFMKDLDFYSDIKVLFTNNLIEHTLNVLTAQDPASPLLFPWNNPFSIAYNGNFADSVKEKVKRAGGKVDGKLRISLAWKNLDDLDLHLILPNGNKIYYGNQRQNGGELDVDMNVSNPVHNAVENIIFSHNTRMLIGTYKVIVHNYTLREKSNTGYIVEIEHDGIIHEFPSLTSPGHQSKHTVIEFSWSRKNGFKIKSDDKPKAPVVKDHWGIKTNRFLDVEHIMFSPNYWGEYNKGNRHVIFTVKDLKNDQKVRPFFNEFLNPDLVKGNKRAFEVLGSKLLVEPSDNQLAGIGFSDAKDNFIIVSYQDESGKRRIHKLLTNK